jgi:putative DNA primase/helicase
MIDALILARALGGDVVGRNVVAAPGPGHSRKDRSLSVRLAGDDFIVHSHAGDDWQTCKDYVRERLGWPQWQPGDGQTRCVTLAYVQEFDHAVVDAESECRERTADDLQRIQRAAAIWHQAINPHDTLAERYLKSRAITLTADVAGTVLRFHPSCPWRDEDSGSTIYLPALIAAFTSIDDGTGTAIQRVALTADATKIGRRMLGPVHRSAVKLDAPGDSLAIAEGVETGLAARQLGHGPVWALGSVGAIAHFPVLEGVACLRVLGEAGKASADAIKIVGQRWHAAGRRVEIVMPDEGYSDLNDELMATSK